MNKRGYSKIDLEVIAPTDEVFWQPCKFRFNPLNDYTAGKWLSFDGVNEGRNYVNR